MRLTLIIIILILLSGSCGEKILTGEVDCNECYAEKPEGDYLFINLTINDAYYPRVPVIVYEGNVEDNNVLTIDTATYSPFEVYVPMDRKYSVRAEYKKDDATLFAIDGTKLELKVVNDVCDGKCYVIEGQTLNAKIKEDFLDF
jgi:hypothetical protein